MATYQEYESARHIIKMCLENSGGSSALAAYHNVIYNQSLIKLALMTRQVDPQELKKWEEEFDTKFRLKEEQD